MSRLYSGQQIRSSRATRQEEFQSYQRNFPQFDLNSRAVKLPPIIKNELLVGRSMGQPSVRHSAISTVSKAKANTSFPKITEAQTPKTTNGTVARSQKTERNRVQVNHVEKAPIHFPNSYKVLPPIGQSNVWRPYNNLTPSRNDVQAPISANDQMNGRRRSSSQRKRSDNQDNGLSPSPNTRLAETQRIETRNSPARNEKNASVAVESRIDHPPVSASDAAPENSGEEFHNEATLPSLSNEDVHVTSCEPIHELERLDLSKEAVEFLASKLSARRVAICIEIDPSLRKAVDIIRDNLLRQTMEELCMLW